MILATVLDIDKFEYMNKNEWQQYYNGEKNYKYSVIHNLDLLKINISALWKTLFKKGESHMLGKIFANTYLTKDFCPKYRKDSEKQKIENKQPN